MRRRDYDVALDLQGLLKSAAMARLSGAGRVIGFETRCAARAGAAWFYTKRRGARRRPRHPEEPVGAAALGSRAAADRAVSVRRARIQQWPVEVASTLPRAAGAGFVLINPGAAWPNKRWPPDRFGAVAARIRERHALPSFVLWGRGEAALADAVVARRDGAAARAPRNDRSAICWRCRSRAA